MRNLEHGEHDKAIERLRTALHQAPLHFLLAASHSEIGLQKRAMKGFGESLRLDPSYVPARLQVGLFHLLSGDGKSAVNIWQPLEALGQDSGPYLFSCAMLAAAREEIELATELLRKVVEAEPIKTPLRRQMEHWVASLDSRSTESLDVAGGTVPKALLLESNRELERRFELPASKRKH